MTAPGDGYPIGAMQFVVDALRATDDPVDAERARLIGFMLVSRGSDFALPSPATAATEIVATAEETIVPQDEAVTGENQSDQPPMLVSDTTTTVAANLSNGKPAVAPAIKSPDACEDILNGASAQIFGHVRDGLAARFMSTREMSMFPDQALSVSEEYTEIAQRELIAAETGAYKFVGSVVDRLFPSSERHYAYLNLNDDELNLSRLVRLNVSNLDRMKRIQSTIIFEKGYYNSHDRGYVVVGAKDTGSKPYFSRALLMDITSHGMKTVDMVREDLHTFMALPHSLASREIDPAVVRQAMANDGTFNVGKLTPGSVKIKWLKDYVWKNKGCKKPVDLNQGIRTKEAYKLPPENAQLGIERLSEAVIEEFEVARHLADLISVLRSA